MTKELKTQTRTDILDPARAAALQATLSAEETIASGSPLPPFFHQAYFWLPSPPSELGRDGHPKVGGGLIPDMGLPRRMWAGGRLRFDVPLIAGVEAERHTVLENVQSKTGRTGPLGIVTLRHELRQGGKLCVTEWQDLVYRNDSADSETKPTPPKARIDETDGKDVAFDSTILFRYSALTFNGHRIHYDLDYAKNVEGYDGLVVHGPLLAQLLMLFATELMGSLVEFSFRATSALMHFESATLCRNDRNLWVRGPDGRQCMQAEAVPRSE
ncbi:acyl dehydratase [Ruegeria arenilitoris]|uniref:acyl dehydratase n=1 Tax=Ruegeria arenilitoris TaxID=1173585 RepID=UPI00147EAF70|nr:acyl dehydratase [Ruegeria arenilitoris]